MRRLTSLLVLVTVGVMAWSCGRELGPWTSGSGGFPSGGTPLTGGTPSGGLPLTGGASGTGGPPRTGGAPLTGGTAGNRTGGAGGTGGGNPVTGGRTGGAPTGGGGIPTGGRTGGVPTGGVPTGGVATGGATPTGGFGGITETPGLVGCGTQVCATAMQQCCLSGSSGATVSTCIPLGAACPGLSIGCAKPSDCSGGAICCLGLSLGESVGIGSSCVPPLQCQLTGVIVCRVDADCTGSRRCCALPGGAGVCRPSC